MGQSYSSDELITIKKIVKTCRTGDIILFSGTSIFSCMVRCVSQSYPWSHVAIVYKKEGYKPFLCESTFDEGELVDVYSNSKKKGVKLVDLEKRLKENKAMRMGYRKLIHTPKDANKKFEEFFIDNKEKDYTEDYEELIGSANNQNDESNHDEFFCSKLVPDALIHMGILKPYKLPNNYNLIDFEHDDLPFLHNIYFGEMKYIS